MESALVRVRHASTERRLLRQSAARQVAREAIVNDLCELLKRLPQPGSGVRVTDMDYRRKLLEGFNHRGLSKEFVRKVFGAGIRVIYDAGEQSLSDLLSPLPPGKVPLARLERRKALEGGSRMLSSMFDGVDVYAELAPATPEVIAQARAQMMSMFPEGRYPRKETL